LTPLQLTAIVRISDGLMGAERQTVSGINRELVTTTDQSCLHRWLTEVQWDVQTLHDRRLAWLQQSSQTRYSIRGGIATADSLTTIGAACRAVRAETLERIVDWIVDQLTVEYWSVPEIKAAFAQS